MTHRDLDDEPWPIPLRGEKPGSPAPRRLTPMGRMIVAGAIVAAVFLATCVLLLVPNPFGVPPG